MSTPSGLTVVLSDSRTEDFASAKITEASYVEYDYDGDERHRSLNYRPWYVISQAEMDGGLVVVRIDQTVSATGDVKESGRREVGRFRPGLWDYVREW